ncbi:hypothetical protein FQA39_LY17689 [Lamprigera yunnana]|nr:hypothetical protein FQA39_LY17689 [Lamprigera yunnana]
MQGTKLDVTCAPENDVHTRCVYNLKGEELVLELVALDNNAKNRKNEANEVINATVITYEGLKAVWETESMRQTWKEAIIEVREVGRDLKRTNVVIVAES